MSHTDNACNGDLDKKMYGGKLHAMPLRQFLNKGRDAGNMLTHAIASTFSLATDIVEKRQREEDRDKMRLHWMLLRDDSLASAHYDRPALRI